ncbi:MAG: flagellar basal-body rod protein FlgG [Candidatus Dactylopiibacterium sp.]|nr:flagellar basal-body rod protein FlgG [Candidatus Dactylopiibacterium sp.]
MMRALWVARTGLDAQQTHLDVISNNLANVSTNGFKRQRAVFEDLLYQTMRQPGAQSSQTTTIPTGLQVGTGVRPIASERIHTQGNLQLTDSSFDMAIQGSGFFQIQMPDGSTAYTRDGAFQRDAQGQLTTSSGYAVQPGITVPADALSITVGKDGTVSVTLPGQTDSTQIGNIQLANFINPEGLLSTGENLYIETPASGVPTVNTPGTNGTGFITQKYVETSNVNVAEELVSMIEAQRAYEINSRVVTTADQMLAKLSNL